MVGQGEDEIEKEGADEEEKNEEEDFRWSKKFKI